MSWQNVARPANSKWRRTNEGFIGMPHHDRHEPAARFPRSIHAIGDTVCPRLVRHE
ncbi:hypothetical protein ABIC51_002954 [Burkholderia sp. 572]